MRTDIPELNGPLSKALEGKADCAGSNILVGGLFMNYAKNDIHAWFEDKTYRDGEHMTEALSLRTRDPENPNPLPSFYVNLGEEDPTIHLLFYDLVTGMDDEDTGLSLDSLTMEDLKAVHEDAGLI